MRAFIYRHIRNLTPEGATTGCFSCNFQTCVCAINVATVIVSSTTFKTEKSVQNRSKETKVKIRTSTIFTLDIHNLILQLFK